MHQAPDEEIGGSRRELSTAAPQEAKPSGGLDSGLGFAVIRSDVLSLRKTVIHDLSDLW